LASGLVLLFLGGLPPALRPSPGKPLRAAEVREVFQELDLRYGVLVGGAERDLEVFAPKLQARGGGLAALKVALGHDVIANYILDQGAIGATEREAALPRDAPREQRLAAAQVPENMIGRLCEECYLGAALFSRMYEGLAAPRAPQAGWIEREVGLLSSELAQELAAHHELILLSERHPAELPLLLERLGLGPCFAATLARDPQGSAPRSPSKLLNDAQGLVAWPCEDEVCLVSGSAELLAAARARGWRAVGFTRDRAARRTLTDAGASAVVGRWETLARAWASHDEV
jgi:phosphoglycolate phosphatase-like HAD superfamily hydrolase